VSNCKFRLVIFLGLQVFSIVSRFNAFDWRIWRVVLKNYIEAYDHWVCIVLLFVLDENDIRRHKGDDEKRDYFN
jgi:hypothetical protein